MPSPDEVATTCPFAARCGWAAPECTAGRPPLAAVEPGRWSACVRIDEIRDELREARAAAAEVAPPLAERAAAGEPIVRIRDLSKSFGADQGARERVDRGLPGRERRARRRVRLGQDRRSRAASLGLETAVGRNDRDRGRRRDRPAAAATTASCGGCGSAVQIVFQDPYSSLNPARTVGATLREALAVAADRREPSPSCSRCVGLPAAYARRKPAALSGGERQRVAIARALAVRPQLLVCDEPVSALDVSVQAQILNLFGELRRELGIAYLFITHDLAVVRQVVERSTSSTAATIVETGSVDHVLDHPADDYTRRLVESVPSGEPGWLTA